MLEVDIDRTRDWDSQTDWERIAEDAVKAAFSVSSHGDLAEAPFTLSISIRLSDDGEVHELNDDESEVTVHRRTRASIVVRDEVATAPAQAATRFGSPAVTPAATT